MKLAGIPIVSNWRSVWKSFSAIALTVTGFVGGLLTLVPDKFIQLTIPFVGYTWQEVGVLVTFIGGVVGLIGRYVDQGLPPPTPTPDTPPRD